MDSWGLWGVNSNSLELVWDYKRELLWEGGNEQVAHFDELDDKLQDIFVQLDAIAQSYRTFCEKTVDVHQKYPKPYIRSLACESQIALLHYQKIWFSWKCESIEVFIVFRKCQIVTLWNPDQIPMSVYQTFYFALMIFCRSSQSFLTSCRIVEIVREAEEHKNTKDFFKNIAFGDAKWWLSDHLIDLVRICFLKVAVFSRLPLPRLCTSNVFIIYGKSKSE